MITRGTAPGRGRRLLYAAFALAVAGQLLVLYLPAVPDSVPTGVPGADKVVHILVFAAVMATGVLAGLRPLWLVLALGIHAPLSEVIQEVALPGRGAELGDVLADVGGIALGWYLAGVVRRRRLGADPEDISVDGRSPSGDAPTDPPPS